ncbi:MAG TPA: GT4 family glycosyltransferase PelF [Candidatus Omnitrophota bacterium]|nr:GT4 family glycosyltransferase PelF [Candidatus Omnitrophota bacterium]
MNDVCLLLEGTYPYVAGGVSTWVYELIRRLDDITFSIVYLGPHRLATRKLHYEIPDNVLDFRELYLFDYQLAREKTRRKKPGDVDRLLEFLMQVKRGRTELFGEAVRILGGKDERTISLHDLAYSREGWELVRKLYESENEQVSFVDYFWTWRFLFLPFFSLLRVELPPARIYHSISTGYAGALGSLAKLKTGRPLLLTEHGIYTRERKIEISKADWIYSKTAYEMKVTERADFFREWWIALFSFLSRLTYESADEIITLYEGNRRVQIEEGADPRKIGIIPNGIDFSFMSRLKKDSGRSRFGIGFVGRVVPIKDVKTFIKACRKICDELENVDIYIIGPTDEDETYYRDCLFLVEMEGLRDVIRFTGKVKMADFYPKLDVVVLTSVSEAQPIVILEALACGIPCVTTDVGACPELLRGRTSEDCELGAAGYVTPICDPDATAKAIIEILKNPGLRRKMAEAGRKRIEKFYQIDDMIADYQMLYNRHIEEVSAGAKAREDGTVSAGSGEGDAGWRG